MATTKQRILGFIALVLACLALTLLPSRAYAYDTSGMCGDDITWTWDASSKTLTLTGAGETFTVYNSSVNERWGYIQTPWVADDWASEIETVNVGEGITRLNGYLFHNCTNMSKINLPTTLEYVGRWFIHNNDALEELDFGNTKLSDSGSYPLDTCTKLKKVTLPDSLTKIPAFFFNETPSLEEFNWPASCTEIGNDAFWACGLKEVTVPETITKMGRYVFEACPNLESVTIKAKVAYMGVATTDDDGNVTGVSTDYTFYNCPKLTSVTLPDTLEYVGPYCFRNCTSLESITLPDNVKSVDLHAFNGCTSLKSVDFDDACTSIGDFAFRNCSGMTQAILPNTITSIGMNAFEGCSSLKTAVIPANVKAIGPHAFDGLAPLSTVYVVGDDAWSIIDAYPEYYGNLAHTRFVHGKVAFEPIVSMGDYVVGEIPSVPVVENNESEAAARFAYFSDAQLSQALDPSTASAGTYYVQAILDETDIYRGETASSSFTVHPATGQDINVFAGSNRYDTMGRIDSGVLNRTTPAGIIVCTGGNFPDALSASGLSGLLGYPIVLTNTNAISPQALATVKQMATAKGSLLDVIVVGGTSAISDGVAAVLANWDLDQQVTRLAGSNRYATAEAVYAYGAQAKGWGSATAIVCSGRNYPDALSASSYAAAKASPILLVASQPTAATLANVKAQGSAVVLGGESAVSADAYNAIAGAASAQRIAGSNRYATCNQMIEWELAHGMTLDGMGFATGRNFPDALTSSGYLGLTNSVLALVDNKTASNAGVLATVEGGKSNIKSISFFGGSSAINDDVRSDIQSTLAWSNPQVINR